MELDRRAAQLGLNRFHQRPALGAGDVAGREVGEPSVADRHQVAADRPVVGTELDAHGRGLQRSPARVIPLGVVAEQAERRHVAGRQEPVGNVPRPADDPLASDPVHLGNPGRFERSHAIESANGSSAAPSGITMTYLVLDMGVTASGELQLPANTRPRATGPCTIVTWISIRESCSRFEKPVAHLTQRS